MPDTPAPDTAEPPAPEPRAPELLPISRTGPWLAVDHHPELFPEHVRAEDAVLMRRAGVNLVRIGTGAWPSLEPEEGEFRFGWLERELDRMAEAGIGVALTVPVAVVPEWFSLAFPGAVAPRSVDPEGRIPDVCAPAFRSATERVCAALAERLADHPALVMVHTHNGLGGPVRTAHAERGFRAWLRERYGDLEALNGAWATAAEGRPVTAWERVTFPAESLPNPGQDLDFRRFCSDTRLAHHRVQRRLWQEARTDLPVGTDLPFDDLLDPWSWSEHTDTVAVQDLDRLPDDPHGRTLTFEHTAFTADLARSYSPAGPEGIPLLVTLGQGHPMDRRTFHDTRTSTLLGAVSVLARGARGVSLGRWRAPRGGRFQWSTAVVGHAGERSYGFRLAGEISELLRPVAELRALDMVVDAAVAWGPASGWARADPAEPFGGAELLRRAREVHKALAGSGHTVRFVDPEHTPDDLPLMVVSSPYLLSAAAVERLTAYAEGGGTLVITSPCGAVDPTGTVWSGGPPGPLRDLLRTGPEGEVSPVDQEIDRMREPSTPITRIPCGQGAVWHVAASVQRSTLTDLFRRISPAHVHMREELPARRTYSPDQLPPDTERLPLSGFPTAARPRVPLLPSAMEAVRRTDGERIWMLLVNHGRGPSRISPERMGLDPAASDLVSEDDVEGLVLGEGEVAMLRGHPR